jgi:TPR repeat protein
LKQGIKEKVPSAMSLMGYMLYYGLGGKANKQLSLILFRRSAELGDPNGMHIWGSILIQGSNGMIQDME